MAAARPRPSGLTHKINKLTSITATLSPSYFNPIWNRPNCSSVMLALVHFDNYVKYPPHNFPSHFTNSLKVPENLLEFVTSENSDISALLQHCRNKKENWFTYKHLQRRSHRRTLFSFIGPIYPSGRSYTSTLLQYTQHIDGSDPEMAALVAREKNFYYRVIGAMSQ